MPPVSVSSSSSLVSGPNTPITTHPPPLVRTVRSGSVNSLPFDSAGFFNYTEKAAEVPITGHRSGRSSIPGNWYFAGDTSSSPTNTSEEPGTTRNTPSDDDEEESLSDSDDEGATNRSTTQTVGTTNSHSHESGVLISCSHLILLVCCGWIFVHVCTCPFASAIGYPS